MSKIITKSPLLAFNDFSQREQKDIRVDFDYIEDLEDDTGFFRVGDLIYNLCEFCTVGMPEGEASDGYMSIIIDGEEVIIL